jgi:hypothetical protein
MALPLNLINRAHELVVTKSHWLSTGRDMCQMKQLGRLLVT